MKQLEKRDPRVKEIVQIGRQHLATIGQIELQGAGGSKLVCAFSLYIGMAYTETLFLLEMLLADLETVPPAMATQINKRLDQLEKQLDHIEQQTAQKIINLR